MPRLSRGVSLREGNRSTPHPPERERLINDNPLPEALALLRDADDTDTNVVYVVQAESGGPVKIGHTTWKARHRRLAELQTGNSARLVFRRIVSGERWLERALHEYYSEQRLEGEWFCLCEELRPLAPAAFDV